MIELVKLETQQAEFARRKVRVYVISLEDQEAARLTQEQFPHLTVVSDAERNLSEAVSVIHANSNLEGGDTSAPTTILVDGKGFVRWTFRPSRYLRRLSPEELLAAIDEHLM